jgi:hypothetical protein
MYTVKIGNSLINFYQWQFIERFSMEFDFIISGHEQIISLGVENTSNLNKKLDDKINALLKESEETHPNDEEYAAQMASDYGQYESIIIHNYTEILWKSTIIYQVNEIESHLKALVKECAEFFTPDTTPPNPKDKIISTYNEYLINTCGIKSDKLNKSAPKMINYYKIRNRIVHYDGVLDDETKEIIRLYKKVDIKMKETYNPSIGVLLNDEFCLKMLSDIKAYFKELYAQVDDAYVDKQKKDGNY